MAAPLIESSIDKLRDLIVGGALSPGSRLPSEHDLAELLGSSRNTTREAVRALVTARVLDVRRGDGTYVTSLKPQLLLEGIGFAVEMMQDDSILELIEIRRLLEPQATAIAARRANSETIAVIRSVLDDMRLAAEDQEALVTHDARFHELVNAASGNQTLASMLSSLSSRMFRARVWRGVIERGATSTTVAQHEQIVEALEKRDPAVAEAAALLHVATTEAWFRRVTARDAATSSRKADLRRPTTRTASADDENARLAQ